VSAEPAEDRKANNQLENVWPQPSEKPLGFWAGWVVTRTPEQYAQHN